MINIPKGTKDVLPTESYRWQFLENTAREIAALFNIREIRTPIFEHTELFLRGVGETTDVVNKEMYTFLDKGNRSITLKPEGTAGAVRAYIEFMQGESLPVKMYYFTPVFRYEKPQAGRLREHHQFGVELFGCEGAEMDVEAIMLAKTFLDRLGIKDLELNINSIGAGKCREDYNNALRSYLYSHKDALCPKCRDRMERNPLRVLDCKEEDCNEIVANAPKTIDYLDDECKAHFERVKELLDGAGIEYTVNPMIVRGLDYYTKTVFEFVTNNIGAKGTVCGGGRYDGLIEHLGGKKTPAVGFGLGLERLLLLMENSNIIIEDTTGVDVFVCATPDIDSNKIIAITNQLRKSNIKTDYDQLKRSLKAQFKNADRLRAKYVLVIGADELASGTIKIKSMKDGKEFSINENDLINTLLKELSK